MKKNVSGQKSRKSGKSTGLSLEKKLLTYSVAAGAVLALTPSADARIHSGPSNCVVQSGTNCLVDFGGAAASPFIFHASAYSWDYGKGSCQFIYKMNKVVIQANGSVAQGAVHDNLQKPRPRNLPPGFMINAGANYGFNAGGTLNRSTTTATNCGTRSTGPPEMNLRRGNLHSAPDGGNFSNSSGYIGVKFNIPGSSCNPVYGWIRYDAVGTGGKTGTVIDWAYEDNCEPIRVGQDHAIPTFTEFGLFLFAALILLVGTRRLRQSADG